MKKNNLFIPLLFFFCAILFSSKAVSQEVREINSIEISERLFNTIKLWQNEGENQRIPLDRYLATQVNEQNDTITFVINELRKSIASKKSTNCGCVTLSVNSSYDIAQPIGLGEYYPPEDQGGLTTWGRTDINGPSTRQRLNLNSLDGNTSYQYSNLIDNQTGTSSAFGRMSFNYLCTNGSLLPANCGCDKTIYLKSGYYGTGSVMTQVQGIMNNRKAQGVIEDASVLFTIDQYQSNTDLTVLKAGTLLVSRSQHEQWNPAAWNNYLNLASSVTATIVAVVGGGALPSLDNIATQIATAANTPVVLQLGSEDSDGTAVQSFAVNYDGGITLRPNHIVTVQMISKSYVLAKGNRKYKVHTNRYSDYFISAVLPFNDSKPECCMEKYAKWISGSMDAIGTPALRNSIGSHVTLWNPWNNLSDANGDGNIDITTSIGFGTNVKQCVVCGLDPLTGLSVRATGLNIASNTRPAVFTWNGQMNVSSYQLLIYNASGILIHTITTSNPFATVNLAPGNYSFKVKALCSNGTSTLSNSVLFTVASLYADPDKDVLAGKNSVLNAVNLYPNPTKNSVVLSTNEDETILSYIIYDGYGSVIKRAQNRNKNNSIDVNVEDLKIGIYLVEITTDKGSYREKLIKE